jgi:hypothetical protein
MYINQDGSSFEPSNLEAREYISETTVTWPGLDSTDCDVIIDADVIAYGNYININTFISVT